MTWVTSQNIKFNVTKTATFFLTRIIIHKLSDKSKFVFRRMERLSKIIVKLNADLKLMMVNFSEADVSPFFIILEQKKITEKQRVC